MPNSKKLKKDMSTREVTMVPDMNPPLGALFVQMVVTVIISPFLFKGFQRILAEAVVQG